MSCRYAQFCRLAQLIATVTLSKKEYWLLVHSFKLCGFELETLASQRCSEQAPLTGDALQVMHPPVYKGQAGSRNQVFHRAGNEHFPGPGYCSNPGREVDGYPCHTTADQLAFSGVETGTNGEPDFSDGVTDGGSAANRTRGAVESR